MNDKIYKSEIVGLLRVIGRELPELAYALSRPEDFSQPLAQQSIRIKLMNISAYIDDVLNHGD